MKIAILIVNIVIFIVLGLVIYKLLKEEWEHIQILEETIDGLIKLAKNQGNINDDVLAFHKSQIEMSTIISESFDRIFSAQKIMNELRAQDRHKIDELDNVLDEHITEEINKLRDNTPTIEMADGKERVDD